jgi:hypothetical protein
MKIACEIINPYHKCKKINSSFPYQMVIKSRFMEKNNFLTNQSYLSLVKTFANISESKEILYVYLETELSLITGDCGVKCETDPNYIGALEQAISLLNECENLEHFLNKLVAYNS